MASAIVWTLVLTSFIVDAVSDCPEFQEDILCSFYNWPQTKPSMRQSLECRRFDGSIPNDTQIVTKFCNDKGQWETSLIRACSLRRLLDDACTESRMFDLENWMDQFEDIPDKLLPPETGMPWDYIKETTLFFQSLPPSLQQESRGNFEYIVTTMNLTEVETFSFDVQYMKIFSTDVSPESFEDDTFLVNTDSMQVMNGDQESDNKVEIPRDILNMAGSSQPGKVRVSVLSYSAPIFSTAMTSSNQSSVFSVHVSGVENQFLDKPVIIQFQNEGGKQGEPVCAYWVTHTRTWSRRGLKTTGGQGVIRCLSNHLTSFSVLFDPVGLEFSLSDDLALTTISQCLGIVSVICLVLTILVYALHPSLLDHSGSILLQLCLSLALLNSVVLVPSVFPTYQLSEQCLNLAIFIHYLTLVALCWMMVEAMNIFQRLVKVFATEESWFLRKRIALCWGAPMLLVGITFGAGYSQYISAVNIDSCVITAQQPLIYYLSFFGPGCVILLVNLTIFVAILRIVVRQRNSSLSRNQAVTSRQVIGVLTVMTLLGIGWLLGVLQVGPVRIFFAYLFVLVNGSQGVIIFIMRCLLHPPALHAIRKSLKFGVSPGQKSSSQGAASFSDSGRSWWKARFSKSSQSTSLIQDVPVDEASDRLKSSFRKSTYTVNP